MRLALAASALLWTVAAGHAADGRFESWTVGCADAKRGPDCRAVTEAAASGARSARLAVSREAAKEAAPRLILTIVEPVQDLLRPRIALAVDGGPPVRLASGADLASSPGTTPGAVDLRLSEAASKRLLPFLRRGRVLQVTVSTDGGERIGAELPLPGFGPAVAEIDARQKRLDRQDALAVLVGGATPAALAGALRDVKRPDVPPTLKQTMVQRDCPVWDEMEADASFLADESFAADLGGGRTLWAVVCTSGSYNVEFALFVEDPSKAADRFDPLLFASFVESIGWTGVDTLSNVAYDPDKKQLTAFEKGRGAGDCGTVGVWEWGGAAFRMVEYRAKEECDGAGKPESFPIVFRGER